ncbi:FHA domain-containing protein [Aquabacterium sp.]|uniref:FHA domain-containing protein n=1 Tax=Aquabacterium sp. TaxID=1872578 RepID=UPI002C3A56FC|nr:FHA domain-containing protein [Aquabacterium sp.]HSW08820.1 FHA domain-containing protein [Aquabacterium sp.]
MDRPEDRLALIELLERDGRTGRAVDVHRWPLTLGRALDNTLVLDDLHVAAAHATLAPDEEGRLVLTVGHSDNGVLVDGKRLAAGQQQVLPAGGALLQLGTARLRLRLRGEPLAPERRLIFTEHKPATMALQAALLLVVMTVRQWVTLDPGADFTAWLPLLFGLPLAVIGWCGAWALVSKLFQHRFDFWGHLRLVLPWVLAVELVEAFLPQLGASLSWPLLWQLSAPVTVVLLALLLRAQLAHVLPQHGRIVTGAVAAVALAFGGVSLATLNRNTDRFTRAPYMSTLPLPALRLSGAVPPQALVESMAPLREQLAQRVRKARDIEAEESADADN